MTNNTKTKFTIALIACAMIFTSCQKDVARPDNQPKIDAISATLIPKNISYSRTDAWTVVQYNTCTNENVQINLVLTETLHTQWKGDTVKYAYSGTNDGTTGVGLTSGKKYTGKGTVTDNFEAVLVGGRYILVKPENVTNYVTLSTPGSNNDLTSYAYYKITMDSTGNASFLLSSFNWNFCK